MTKKALAAAVLTLAALDSPVAASAVPKLTPAQILAAMLTAGTVAPAVALEPAKAIGQYSHAVWQEKNGLPSDMVSAVLQTRDGYLWFGTLNGLARFDGVRITTFEPHTAAPLLHRIRSLYEARDGSLWIGSRGGLTRLFDGRFESMPMPEGRRRTNIREIVEDGEGRLWARTLADLFVVDSGRLRFVTHGVRSLRCGDDGRLRIATADGIGRVEQDRLVVERAVPLVPGEARPLSAVETIVEEADGTVWVGAAWGLGRLSARGEWAVFGTAQGLPGAGVTALHRDRHGVLWVGTTGGLARFAEGRLARQASHPLVGPRVLALYEDAEGSLWVGTDTDGVHQLRDGPFTPVTTREGLSDDLVRPILQARDGSLWIGTARGLNRLRDGRIESFTKADGLPGDDIYALAEDGEGRLWIGTDRGLARFESGRLRAFPLPGLAPPFAVVIALAFTRDGAAWIGTDIGGLFHLARGAVTHHTRQTGLSDNHVARIHERPDGSVWLATDSGITVFRDGRPQVFGVKDGLTSPQVRVFHEAAGDLWIGTYGGGLLRFREGRFEPLPASAGLPDTVVYEILEDGRGQVWMTSNRGIVRVARARLERLFAGHAEPSAFALFAVGDGLKSSTAVGNFQPAACATRDGRLWFPTRRGAVWVDPARVPDTKGPPRALIERVVLDGRPQPAGDHAKAPPGRGDVAIEYTAPSFRNAATLGFRYRLDGLDDDWRDSGGRRTAHFANVPPGRYTFRVAAVTPDGRVGPEAATLELELEPHFHQTAWFYSLCVVAAGVATGGVHRLKLRRVRRRFAAVLAERGRIAREMHDSLDQGLTAVSLQLEVCARLANGSTTPGPALQKRLDLARDLIDYTRSEARRSIADLRSEALESGSLVAALSKVAEQFGLDSKLRVGLSVEGRARPLPGTVESNLLRICQEAVTNAIRHGQAREVAIGLAFEREAVRLTVEDSGCGFDPLSAASERDGHFGLMGMRERVKKLGGRLRLESQHGKGTAVRVEIPLTPQAP